MRSSEDVYYKRKPPKVILLDIFGGFVYGGSRLTYRSSI